MTLQLSSPRKAESYGGKEGVKQEDVERGRERDRESRKTRRICVVRCRDFGVQHTFKL